MVEAQRVKLAHSSIVRYFGYIYIHVRLGVQDGGNRTEFPYLWLRPVHLCRHLTPCGNLLSPSSL